MCYRSIEKAGLAAAVGIYYAAWGLSVFASYSQDPSFALAPFHAARYFSPWARAAWFAAFRRGALDVPEDKKHQWLCCALYYVAWSYEFGDVSPEAEKILEYLRDNVPSSLENLLRPGAMFTDRYHDQARFRIAKKLGIDLPGAIPKSGGHFENSRHVRIVYGDQPTTDGLYPPHPGGMDGEMKKIGPFEFPETSGERTAWRPDTCHRALAARVLCAMTTRPDGKWAAYVDAVPGMSHPREQARVLEHGQKLPESLARAVFAHVPEELPYAL